MSESDGTYWEGATWVYHTTITNGAGGGGTIEFTIVPGAGTELEILYGEIINGDTVARTCKVHILDDDDNRLGIIQSKSVSAAVHLPFPTNGTADLAELGTTRLIVSREMKIYVAVESVAASQDATLALVCRIRGALPAVAEAGNSTPTITINKEQVF